MNFSLIKKKKKNFLNKGSKRDFLITCGKENLFLYF